MNRLAITAIHGPLFKTPSVAVTLRMYHDALYVCKETGQPSDVGFRASYYTCAKQLLWLTEARRGAAVCSGTA